MIRYLLPIESLKQSTNKIYAGVHWSKRKEFKDNVLSYAKGFCRPVQKIKSYPVEICYKFVFGSKPLDTTNCTFLIKCIEDAFRTLEILTDDSPAYVAKTIIEVPPLAAEERSAKIDAYRKEKDAKDADWLEIIIKNYNT